MSLPRALLLAVALVLVVAAPASAADPPLTVSNAKLDRALVCKGKLQRAGPQPIMLVTGTGASGDEAYLIGKPALDNYGHPVCVVNFPYFTTGDIQIAVQYLVHGIRVMNARAHRPIAVFGISQGGLLPRIALTYWPSLRSKVTDVLAAAGTQHGSTLGRCAKTHLCTPASWQQAAGSHLLRALNSQPDESPGPAAWTTVRSLTDETVQPQGGRHPTSALRGATNILIQSVCPGRKTSHIGTALDSVTFAAFRDALAHRGPAEVSRLPKTVCDDPFAPGLDPMSTMNLLGAAGTLTGGRGTSQPRVRAEPRVRPLFLRKVR